MLGRSKNQTKTPSGLCFLLILSVFSLSYPSFPDNGSISRVAMMSKLKMIPLNQTSITVEVEGVGRKGSADGLPLRYVSQTNKKPKNLSIKSRTTKTKGKTNAKTKELNSG